MKYNKNEVTGKMRDRIILQNVTRSRSLTGFASESWADTTTIWAFAESKLPGSNENIIDGKNTAKNVCDFTIRYISTISEESRVIWGDKLYQVKNIKVSHDRRFISFQGIFYDSYILTGVNVAAAVSGIATSTANIKLLMSVIGQANAIASAIGEITTAQQGVVEVASNVTASGTSEASIRKVISLDGNLAGSAFVDATPTIVQYIATSVNATASSIADTLVSKTLNANVQGNATATSALDVISQGITSVDASVTATGSVTADILRIATLESSSNTTADTTANATLTKVLEASASATAQTSSDAQLTLAINASASATANTSADAQLSYTVNATANATAQTNADAFITRIISAEATATANSSAEAGVGVTFVAAAVGVATSTSADLFRTATMSASVTASGNVAANAIIPIYINSSINASASVTIANLQLFDPNFANVSLLLHGNGADGSTTFTDNSPNSFTVTGVGNAQIDTAIKQFGTGSIQFDGNGDYLEIPDNNALDLSGDFTIELFFRLNSLTNNSQHQTFIVKGDPELPNNFTLQLFNNGNQLNFRTNATSIFLENVSLSINVFYHLALSRSGSNLRMYFNGNQIGTTQTNSTDFTNTNVVRIGGRNIDSYGGYLNGFIDEFRITKGVARYTGSTLTVPTSQFPDQ